MLLQLSYKNMGPVRREPGWCLRVSRPIQTSSDQSRPTEFPANAITVSAGPTQWELGTRCRSTISMLQSRTVLHWAHTMAEAAPQLINKSIILPILFNWITITTLESKQNSGETFQNAIWRRHQQSYVIMTKCNSVTKDNIRCTQVGLTWTFEENKSLQLIFIPADAKSRSRCQ